MAGRYTDCILTTQRGQHAGTLLRGGWASLLRWPEARRVECIDYPERDGKEVDFGDGLYAGAPRELLLPLYFRGKSSEELRHLLRIAPKLTLRIDSLAYRAGVQVAEVGAVTQGRHGAWAEVQLLEGALPVWFAQDMGAAADGVPLGTLPLRGGAGLDGLGVGVVPGVWIQGGGTRRKRLSNAGYALADGVGREEAKVVLPCAMGGFRHVSDLLQYYGAAWRWFVSRIAEAELRTARAVYYGARYESQRVVAFAPARRLVQFEVTLAVRRVEVL